MYHIGSMCSLVSCFSQNLRDALDCMYDAKVPEMWRKVGWGTSDKLANLIG